MAYIHLSFFKKKSVCAHVYMICGWGGHGFIYGDQRPTLVVGSHLSPCLKYRLIFCGGNLLKLELQIIGGVLFCFYI